MQYFQSSYSGLLLVVWRTSVLVSQLWCFILAAVCAACSILSVVAPFFVCWYCRFLVVLEKMLDFFWGSRGCCRCAGSGSEACRGLSDDQSDTQRWNYESDAINKQDMEKWRRYKQKLSKKRVISECYHLHWIKNTSFASFIVSHLLTCKQAASTPVRNFSQSLLGKILKDLRYKISSRLFSFLLFCLRLRSADVNRIKLDIPSFIWETSHFPSSLTLSPFTRCLVFNVFQRTSANYHWTSWDFHLAQLITLSSQVHYHIPPL